MGEQVVRTNCYFASISTLIQSLIWLTIHLCCILCNMDFIIINEDTKAPTSNRIFQAYYGLFLNSSQGPMLGFYMHVHNFSILSFIYLIVTAMWFCVSCYLLRNSIINAIQSSFIPITAWIVLTVGLSLLDVIVLGFLCFDYNEFGEVIEPHNIYINTAYIFEMLIATRFVVFWISNNVFAITFIVTLIKKTYLREDKFDWPGMFNSNVETYNPQTLTRISPVQENTAPFNYVNSSYLNDDDNSSLGSRFTDMFANVSNRNGNYRRSPTLRKPIPVISPPNPAYRSTSPNHLQRRRNLTSNSSQFNDNNDPINRDPLFAY